MGFFVGGPLGDLWSSCGAPMGARMGGRADALWLFGLRAQVGFPQRPGSPMAFYGDPLWPYLEE